MRLAYNIIYLGRNFYVVDSSFLFYASNPVLNMKLDKWIHNPQRYFWYTDIVKTQTLKIWPSLPIPTRIKYLSWPKGYSNVPNQLEDGLAMLQELLDEDLSKWRIELQSLFEASCLPYTDMPVDYHPSETAVCYSINACSLLIHSSLQIMNFIKNLLPIAQYKNDWNGLSIQKALVTLKM